MKITALRDITSRRFISCISKFVMILLMISFWVIAVSGADFKAKPDAKKSVTSSVKSPSGAKLKKTGDSSLIVKTPIDRLSAIWTFGNHEPITMYKRVGRLTTGGAEGNSHWLEEWHHWFDSAESAKLMQELGLTHLHSRYYKGMGWEFESKDFPNVKKFVKNCHDHNVKVLAYVQYSTLYYEIMKKEYPHLEDWASRDINGKIQYYGSSYFRWLPCPNAPEQEALLKKVVGIALTQGDFDGIMYDNLSTPPCYCNRCQKLFKEHLRKITDLEKRFGLPTVEYMTAPPVISGEIKDPLCQEWIRFRCDRINALFHRLFVYAKKCRPDALITGNTWDYNQSEIAGRVGIEQLGFSENFDFILSQNLNVPGFSRGYMMNRVHELELGDALGIPILALCDSDGGKSSDNYYLPLIEDAVFGGIPADRTIISPDRKEMVNRKELEHRRPMLDLFRETVRENKLALSAKAFAPVKILYSVDSMMFSKDSWNAIFTTEEILLKNHLPFGLLIMKSGKVPAIPDDCEVLVIPDQRCLSDDLLAEVIRFVRRGGRLISLGENGLCDELYRQRKNNDFIEHLRQYDNKNVRVHEEPFTQPGKSSNRWLFADQSPEKKRLPFDIAALWDNPFKVEAPPTVLMKIRQSGQKTFIHFVNYSDKPVQGVKLTIADKKSAHVSVPLEKKESIKLTLKKNQKIELPEFQNYALVVLAQ